MLENHPIFQHDLFSESTICLLRIKLAPYEYADPLKTDDSQRVHLHDLNL